MAGRTALATTNTNHSKQKTQNGRHPHNPLLVKHVVGKTRQTVYDLPGEDHVYGKQIERDSTEKTGVIAQNQSSKATITAKHSAPALDYITMNRNAAKKGIISPKSIREYREENPIRCASGDHSLYNGKASGQERGLQRTRGPLPSDTNVNFTYGKPTRPSTPVSCLMTDRYQREWLDQLESKQKEQEKINKTKTAKKQTAKIAISRQRPAAKAKLSDTSNLNELFKMSKFKKIGPKVVSHRPDNDKAMAGIIGKDRAKVSAEDLRHHKDKSSTQICSKGVGFKPKVKLESSNVAAAAEPLSERHSTHVDFSIEASGNDKA
ncbi:hypothetical protein BDV3_002634 [Batrachochytrium dendrobatidis]